MKTKLGELSVNVSSFQLLAKALRPLPEKWHGLSDIDTRYRQRYVDLIANDDARRVFDIRFAAIGAIRRFLAERGFVEVETPVLHPIAGGATAQAVLDAPQRARRRALPAHRARAVPEAAHRRRLRQGVRDRARVPQRRAVDPAQPRVHDARALRGVRRLHRHDAAHRGADRRRGARRRSAARPSSGTAPRSTSRRRSRGARCSTSSASTPASTCTRRSRSRSCARRCDALDVAVRAVVALRASSCSRSTRRRPRRTSWSPTFVCDYPRDVSPLARDAPRRPHADRAVRAHRRRPRARQRVQRAQRSRRPAAPLRGPGVAEAARRRRGAGHRRRLRARARVRPAADRRPRPRHRPARDAARGRDLDPRGDPVPAPAARKRTKP